MCLRVTQNQRKSSHHTTMSTHTLSENGLLNVGKVQGINQPPGRGCVLFRAVAARKTAKKATRHHRSIGSPPHSYCNAKIKYPGIPLSETNILRRQIATATTTTMDLSLVFADVFVLKIYF